MTACCLNALKLAGFVVTRNLNCSFLWEWYKTIKFNFHLDCEALANAINKNYHTRVNRNMAHTHPYPPSPPPSQQIIQNQKHIQNLEQNQITFRLSVTINLIVAIVFHLFRNDEKTKTKKMWKIFFRISIFFLFFKNRTRPMGLT